jgi:hypothetical protein
MRLPRLPRLSHTPRTPITNNTDTVPIRTRRSQLRRRHGPALHGAAAAPLRRLAGAQTRQRQLHQAPSLHGALAQIDNSAMAPLSRILPTVSSPYALSSASNRLPGGVLENMSTSPAPPPSPYMTARRRLQPLCLETKQGRGLPVSACRPRRRVLTGKA